MKNYPYKMLELDYLHSLMIYGLMTKKFHKIQLLIVLINQELHQQII